MLVAVGWHFLARYVIPARVMACTSTKYVLVVNISVKFVNQQVLSVHGKSPLGKGSFQKTTHSNNLKAVFFSYFDEI